MNDLSSYRHIHFVTGRLAEPALRRQAETLANKFGFAYSIDVLPITVAALLNVNWVLPRLDAPAAADLILLPGYCQGDLDLIQSVVSCDVLRGPKDLRQLPSFFGQKTPEVQLDQYSIDIIAEINHAPQLSLQKIAQLATHLSQQGADIIDIGCEPGQRWMNVGDAVQCVRDLGYRVSVDSMDVAEIADAVAAGAELVLSVNQTTAHAAKDWDAEVVVIPNEPNDWSSLEQAVEVLQRDRIRFRIDPILEPIGFGFARSLGRYQKARTQWPDAEIMMGVGNLTELTDVDSAGINVLLLGICQELGIRSVLTTQVINWARTSVKELDVARRLVYYSIENQVPPKRVTDQLIQLRDDQLVINDMESLEQLAATITDPNYRIFVVDREIVCLGDGKLWNAKDPFELYQKMQDAGQANLDPSHSFYLGFEMCKAMIAGQLGKNYNQDQALNWGHLTEQEPDRHIQRTKRSKI